MSRKKARAWAMKCFYELEMKGDFTKENMDDFLENHEISGDVDFIREILTTFLDHQEEIDEAIKKASDWPFDKLNAVDLAILRTSVTEILYSLVPVSVSINEAVELAKKYSIDRASSFINGVLSAVEKGMENGETT